MLPAKRQPVPLRLEVLARPRIPPLPAIPMNNKKPAYMRYRIYAGKLNMQPLQPALGLKPASTL
ncbi:hypothetical protein D3C84_1279640 [compost metagenome]